MITLGTFDENVTSSALDAYKHLVKTTMIGTDPLPEWHNQLREEGKWVNYSKLSADEGITVAKLQNFCTTQAFWRRKNSMASAVIARRARFLCSGICAHD
ncbi:MAG: hypothetical protein U0Y68_12270 [Blastocatellia bacterium]